MEKILKEIDYADLVTNRVTADHIIGKDVILLDEHSVPAVSDHEFISVSNTFIEVIEGEGAICVNGTEYPVNGHCLIVYLKGQHILTNIRGEHSIQRGFVLSDSFLESMYHDAPRFNEIRFSIMENPVVPLTNKHQRALELYVRILREIASQGDEKSKRVSAKFATLAMFYGSLQYAFIKKIDTEAYRGPRVSAQFFTLLEAHFKEEHTLSYYSSQMKMTRQYLHVTVMAATGKAPGYWVDQYLVNEAKKLLSEPTIPIYEISEILHFKGCEQFGRFFKKQTGMTPRDYRKSLDCH